MIKFRENWSTQCVDIFQDDVFVAGFPEYRMAATYSQQRFSLTDEQLMEIYRDYKEDYDS